MPSETAKYPESFERFRKERLRVNLSPQQCEAVCSVNGPVLLLAVPGSGKTTVLISRLGYMIYELGIDPESILTMTYTVAATGDMKRRFVSFFGDGYGDRVEFRTINGVCAKIIMYYGRTENRKVFELAEDGETRRIVLDILREKLSDFPTDNDIQEACTKIAYAKNMLLSDEQISRIECADLPFGEVYAEYRTRLRARGLMDYDDQLVYAYEILKKYPSVLDYYRKQFRYICVDEAQDTSKIQHEIIALLAGKSGNLFMVGDEDQSIYGFRAAYPEALMTFRTDHPGAKILVMDMNYRSDANIVAAADGFIRGNLRRYDKTLRPSKPAENKIITLSVRDRKEQFDYLYRVAKKCAGQTAVLYRDNDSALPLADRLEREGLPFNIRTGDYGFFTHKIIRDIKNIILFASDPSNTDIFMQIYNRMQIYLKRQDALKVCEISKAGKISIPSALLSLKTLSDGNREACANFCVNLRKIPDDSAEKAVKRILGDMNYAQYLRRNNMSIGKVQVLLMLAEREKSGLSLIKRLEYLERVLKEKENDPECSFIMSTVHSAKGLEYKTVYIADAVDGIFPASVPSAEDARAAKREISEKGKNASELPVYDRTLRQYEEERRLFYVAVTRAIERLYIFTVDGEKSVFCGDLFNPSDNSAPSSAAGAVQTGFDAFAGSLVPSARVVHKVYGPGVVREKKNDIVFITFGDGNSRMFSIRTMYDRKLIRTVE